MKKFILVLLMMFGMFDLSAVAQSNGFVVFDVKVFEGLSSLSSNYNAQMQNWRDVVVYNTAPTNDVFTMSPTNIEYVTSVNPAAILNSQQNSWMGSTNTTAQYSGEYGGRLFSSLHVVNTNGFFANNLTFKGSSDGNNILGLNFSYSGYSFTSNRIGISFGADGIKGTGDDIVYTSGSMSGVSINEFFTIGVGNGIYVAAGTNQQQQLDLKLDWVQNNLSFYSNSWSYVSGGVTYISAGNVVYLQAVPEPCSIFLILLGGVITTALFSLRAFKTRLTVKS